jgi:serine/threonine protein kinase
VCVKGQVDVPACVENLRQVEHFHAVMPLMNGSLDRFITPKMSIQTRMHYVAPVVEDMECVHKVGYAYTDMKLENMMFRTVGKETSVHLADLGSLCKIGEPAPQTKAGAYCRVDAKNAQIIVNAFTLEEAATAAQKGFELCNPHTATFVNIFQRVVLPNGSASTLMEDYMLCNNFTNQFSVVILLLDTLNIGPPSYEMINRREEYKNPAGYIKAKNEKHKGDDAKPWLDLIERVWNACNELKFYSTKPPNNRGTKKNYLQNIAKSMRALLS